MHDSIQLLEDRGTRVSDLIAIYDVMYLLPNYDVIYLLT